MAIETFILKSTDNVRQGGPFEAHNHSISLLIEDCGGTALTSSSLVLEFLADPSKSYSVLADVGRSFRVQSEDTWVDYLPSTEFGAWRVRSIDVTAHDSKANTWKVTIMQGNMGAMKATDEAETIFGVPSLSVNKVARTRKVNAWRAAPEYFGTDTLGTELDAGSSELNGAGAIWANCSDDWSLCTTGDDCGGIPIDINGGNPTQFNVGQEQITIEFISRAPFANWGESLEESMVTSPLWTNLYYLTNLLNTRNAEEWFGYAKGYLLVADVSVQPLGHEFKKVVLTLLYDKWQHADQRPWMTSGGVVSTLDTCSDVTPDEGDFNLVNLTASTVWWLQPYQQLGSLGGSPRLDLFPVGVMDQADYQLQGQVPNFVPAELEGCEGDGGDD